jgi:anti-sigma-K factor RskA
MNPEQLNRWRELIADEQLDQLSLEDRAELEELRHMGAPDMEVNVVGELLNRMGSNPVPLPPEIRERLMAQGKRVILGQAQETPVLAGSRWTRWMPFFVAASVLVAGGGLLYGIRAELDRRAEHTRMQTAQAQLEAVRASNAELLQVAEARAAALTAASGENRALQEQLAKAAAEEVRLARALADATSGLEQAQLTIAKYEAPEDPLELAARRRTLLSAPGTIRVAWQPFDLPDAPAEQRQVQGDVIWNDEQEQGFLRFVGLKVNDPAVEQYQVWVIDERGMEQKVSGGVFNATQDGEVIVPIHPAIDVRRVALFAITIEEPGGTWVPNLKRRVVVAPRT